MTTIAWIVGASQVRTISSPSSRQRGWTGHGSVSSPRARGTGWLSHPAACGGRFIPARAGNGAQFGPTPPTPTVHPRARGERSSSGANASRAAGSSPRARGTAVRHRGKRGAQRFIPARAGNGEASLGSSVGKSVHPRARGERDLDRARAMQIRGSSPRARGTGGRGQGRLRDRRFIPARAGNGWRWAACSRASAVHPRARGERKVPIVNDDGTAGSSPRARGTGAAYDALHSPCRFIPARAGNGRS